MSETLITTTPPSGRAPRGGPGRSARRGRGLRALSTTLIAIGILVLLDAGVTLVWQEPISALYATLQQSHLRSALRQIEHARPTGVERLQLARLSDRRRRIAFLAGELQRHTRPGSPVGSIHIPRIGASFVVIDGTGSSELERGPGVYPDTRFPGLGGTTAIAGHRTTWLAPFRRINELRSGARILLDMPYAHFLYTVTGHRVVEPTDVAAAIDQVGYSRLVLSACTPLFSAAQRILVYARLTSVVPVGAALTSGARTPPPGTPRHPSAA
jgi:sortase A